MGAERRSAVLTPESLKMTAYHEGGHALVAMKTDGADPVHKMTIMPVGQALGYVMQLPKGDQTSMSRKQMLAKLDVCMGGRIAEELIFGAENVTSGASSDIMQATRLARAMVTKWGMTKAIGVMLVGDEKTDSPDTRDTIDREVRKLLDESYARATALLETHRRELDMLAKACLEYESLTGEEITDVLRGRKIRTTKPVIKPKQKPAAEKPAAEKPARSWGASKGAAAAGAV